MAVFNCNLCPQTFTRKYHLERHLGTVHGENNFKCDQCDQSFSLAQHLNRHVKGVHENKSFECEVCDFTTTRNDSLKRHNEMKHGIKKIKLSPPAVDTSPKPKATPTVEPSSAVEPQDEPCDKVKSAFNKKMYKKTWKPRGLKDLLKAFAHYKGGIQRSLDYHLKKFGPLKFYITFGVKLYKIDKEEVREETFTYFSSQTRTLLHQKDFEKVFKASKDKIWKDFDKWLKEGSGWRLDYIQNIDLNICQYKPIRGSTLYRDT